MEKLERARVKGIGVLVKQVLARSTLAIMAVVGLTLATAGPAAAAETGRWRAYGNTNPITSSSSTWACNHSISFTPNVAAQVCTVRSPDGGYVQGAVIVRNNRSTLYYATATMYLYNTQGYSVGEWTCPSSGVGANSWSVCFGRTFKRNSPIFTSGTIDGHYLGQTPLI